MKLNKLKSDFEHHGIKMPNVHTHTFIDFKNLPKSKGVYCIFHNDLAIYAGKGGGKGGIWGRFNPYHHDKAYGIYETKKGTRNSTSHSAGWVYARENSSTWNPDEWAVEYILLDSAADRTLIESIMIKHLDPLCNDENFEDRSK